MANARGDRIGTAHAIGAALDLVYRTDGAGPAIDRWIAALDRLVADGYPALPPAVEGRLLAGALGVLGRRPDHPLLPLWAEQAKRLVDDGHDAPIVVPAARYAFEFAVRGGNFTHACHIVAAARERLGDAPADPALALEWQESHALLHWLRAEHALARDIVRDALQRAGDVAADGMYGAHEQGASAAMSEGDLAGVDAHLAWLAPRARKRRRQDVAHLHFLAAGRALLGGDRDRAQREIAACLRTPAQSTPLFFSTLWRLGGAHVSIERGDARRAERELRAVLAQAKSLYWRYLEFSARLHRAWLRCRQQRRDESLADLRRALLLRAAHDYRNCDPWWNPRMIAELHACAAMDAELAPDFVTFSGRGATAPEAA